MSEMVGQNLTWKNLADCCKSNVCICEQQMGTFMMMIAVPLVNQNSMRKTLETVSRLQPVFLAATVFKLARVLMPQFDQSGYLL